MDEMGQGPSSTKREASEDNEEVQPVAKRLKKTEETVGKLERRLGSILCCAVCLDLSSSAIFQCSNGHLMCAACFTHLLADARIRDEPGTCPNCRVEISSTLVSRNLAVENAIQEMPDQCRYCKEDFPRKMLPHHEQEVCLQRPVICMFTKIGCKWSGPFSEKETHEENCSFPQSTGVEILEALQATDGENQERKSLYERIISLLSYGKIVFNDLQMKSYRTDDFVSRLFYETPRFNAFNYQWVVKTRINNNERDPSLSTNRELAYQVNNVPADSVI